MAWLGGLFRPWRTAEPAVKTRLAEALTLANAGGYQTALPVGGPLAHRGFAWAANNIGACFLEGRRLRAGEIAQYIASKPPWNNETAI